MIQKQNQQNQTISTAGIFVFDNLLDCVLGPRLAKETNNKINEAVCRTAPATPFLLNTWIGLIKVNEDRRVGFPKSWPGCSEGIPEGKTRSRCLCSFIIVSFVRYLYWDFNKKVYTRPRFFRAYLCRSPVYLSD